MRRIKQIALLVLLHILLIVGQAIAQNEKQTQLGHISYVGHALVYVKFENTKNIQKGDTLFNNDSGFLKACLIVESSSSISAACKKINDCELHKNAEMVHLKKSPKTLKTADIDILTKNETQNESISHKSDTIRERQGISESEATNKKSSRNIRLSLANYNNIREGASRGSQRIRLHAKLNNIQGSRFSIESYMNYQAELYDERDRDSPNDNRFRLFRLALKYEKEDELLISVGRNINANFSSVGAFDGLQAIKYFGHFGIGAMVGSRPNRRGFGYDPSLLEYGGYISHNNDWPNGIQLTHTVGIINQLNAGTTDRRYIFAQSSMVFSSTLSTFLSVESDIYESYLGSESTNPQLTQLFASLRYRPFRFINLSAAYSNRRRIIYYESQKDFLDRYIDQDNFEGYRFNMRLSPFKYFNCGGNYNLRLANRQNEESDNFSAYLSYYRLPWVNAGLYLSYNQNETIYNKAHSYFIRLNKSFLKSKVDLQVSYRLMKNQYKTRLNNFEIVYYGLNIGYRISSKIRLMINAERSVSDFNNMYRINSNLNFRL